MTQLVKDTAFGIVGLNVNGEMFLYSGTAWTRTQAITTFCHDFCTSGAELPEIALSLRRLDPRVKTEWKKHYARGRRCVRVTITARVK